MDKKAELGSYLLLSDANMQSDDCQITFMDYYSFLLSGGYDALDKYLLKRLDLKKIPRRSEDDILSGALADSLADLGKKQADKNYYVCNALCFREVLHRIFNQDLYQMLSQSDNVHLYKDILQCLMRDMDDLLNLYDNLVKNDDKYLSSFNSRFIHSMSIHQVLRQSLYGTFSHHSFSDLETMPPVAVIRQIIELRLRRALGILAFIDEHKNLVPLSMSTLFNALEKHLKLYKCRPEIMLQ